jgi:hypothetical protein
MLIDRVSFTDARRRNLLLARHDTPIDLVLVRHNRLSSHGLIWTGLTTSHSSVLYASSLYSSAMMSHLANGSLLKGLSSLGW